MTPPLDLSSYSDRDLFEHFIERAAIGEYCGKMGREHATIVSAMELKKIIGKLPQLVLAEVERVRNQQQFLNGCE